MVEGINQNYSSFCGSVDQNVKPKKGKGLLYGFLGAGLATQVGYFMFNRKIDKDTVQWQKEFEAKGATPELGARLNKLQKLNEIGGKVFKFAGLGLLAASIVEFIRVHKSNKK